MSSPELTLGVAGDFCLAAANDQGSEYVSEVCSFTRALTAETDWSMANLEFCICPNQDLPATKMCVPEHLCSELAQSGFSTFCLANNHILDGGERGLRHTMAFLDHCGATATGAGHDLSEAATPLLMDLKGRRLAVISATDATHYAAGRHHLGVASLNAGHLLSQVRAAAKTADIVIVNIHADFEFTNLPAPWKVRLSRRLANAGASIVVHHHPHTLQGIEYHNGCLIAYSLGNLVFPLSGNSYLSGRPGRVDEGAFLKVEVTFDMNDNPLFKYAFIPTIIDDSSRTRLAVGEERCSTLRALNQYSASLADARLLRRAHLWRCRQETKWYLAGMYYALAKHGPAGWWDHAIHPLRTRMARHGLRGLMTAGFC